MEKKQLEFSFKAPYYKIGEFGRSTENIWMIFHGYGQLAEDFKERFSCLDTDENVLLFPQGLSKFYLKGIDKKIGASWMTAYEREADIDNYVRYIQGIYQLEVYPYNCQLNILGFSQGVHTASRWIYKENIDYSKLIVWGAGLASEVDARIVDQYFSMGKNIFVIGDQDRYIGSEELKSLKKRYSSIGLKYDLIEYHGGHDIYPDILTTLL
jgi:predicted esterase